LHSRFGSRPHRLLDALTVTLPQASSGKLTRSTACPPGALAMVNGRVSTAVVNESETNVADRWPRKKPLSSTAFSAQSSK
jgi:hypothetical protein